MKNKRTIKTIYRRLQQVVYDSYVRTVLRKKKEGLSSLSYGRLRKKLHFANYMDRLKRKKVQFNLFYINVILGTGIPVYSGCVVTVPPSDDQ